MVGRRGSTRVVTAAVALVALFCTSAAAEAEAEAEAGNTRSPPAPPLPPLANGLSYDFYRRSCPRAEAIVRSFVHDAVRRDVGLAAGFLRLHFHDCFVQGCDASLLLEGSHGRQGEQEALPNLTLRRDALNAVDAIRDRLDRECGGAVVSCADLALAARDSVVEVHVTLTHPSALLCSPSTSINTCWLLLCLVHACCTIYHAKMLHTRGPSYKVPLGRRDSASFASAKQVVEGLPPPSSHVPALLAALSKVNLDAADLVALSGGHTIGLAHCKSFEDRLFPRPDPAMNATFAARLRRTCPAKGAKSTAALDVRTADRFDNKYYVDLVNREGLLTSDQDLFTDPRTRPIVAKFARSQKAFFRQFKISMVKVGQINVLAGAQGQVRWNCKVPNNPGTIAAGLPWPIVDEAESLVF